MEAKPSPGGEQEAAFTVLLVDDDVNYRASVRRFLAPDGYVLLEAGSGEEAIALLARRPVDLALVDVWMPGMDGLALLARVRSTAPSMPVIMLTAFGELGTVVEAMKAGATDFLEKSVAEQALGARLAQARRIWELENDNRRLREEGRPAFDFPRLVGTSPSMRRLKEAIAQVGPSDASVLIEGETGTGKELVARAIHHHSTRRGGPFVAVDCASISESLMESELFGHVKGAYTGAHASEEGLFRSAEGGTVFLDELGEIPLSMQVKLLRVMQEREIRPVGSSKSVRVDIRVIAATNRHLAAQIARGGFREDLYYRIAVVTLEVPPLRERGEDIGALAESFLGRIRGPAESASIDPEALRCLNSYSWPGNVRELENVMQRATVLNRGRVIRAVDLPESMRAEQPAAAAVPDGAAGDMMESYEKAAIASALAKTGGSRREAARLLGIGEATLYRRLRLYNLK